MSHPGALARSAALAAALAIAWPGSPAPAAAPAAPAAPAPPGDPRSLSFAPLTVSFPKPERVFLPNGLLAYLFVDREIPIIDLGFYVKAGSNFDPAGKEGLAAIATTMMRTGGTRDLSPDEVDETLEFMPAQIRIAADHDAVSGSVSALKGEFPKALGIFAAMLRAPRFDAARLEVERARLIEDIRRRWDEPAVIADLNFRRLVYGAASPWARLETAESIGRVTRDDLQELHRRYFKPNNVVFGVAGDFDPAAMKRLLEVTFGAWERGKVTLPPVPKVGAAIPVGVHLVERPLPQSSIVLGHLGVNRFDPDKFPLKILNFILGEGGFTSRLVREVRSTRGLAYGIGGGVGMDSDRGLFAIDTRTKAASTVETIAAVRDIIRALRDEGPTEAEVREAQEASINSFVFSVDGTVPYMATHLFYDFYGYAPDYLRTYRDNLAKVTREQVARAARKHLDPDRMVVLVVGDPAAFGTPLSTLGMGEPRRLALEAAAPAAAPGR